MIWIDVTSTHPNIHIAGACSEQAKNNMSCNTFAKLISLSKQQSEETGARGFRAQLFNSTLSKSATGDKVIDDVREVGK